MRYLTGMTNLGLVGPSELLSIVRVLVRTIGTRPDASFEVANCRLNAATVKRWHSRLLVMPVGW